jgi:hypothetical protein
MINEFQYGHGSQDFSGSITSTQLYGYSGAMTLAFPQTPTTHINEFTCFLLYRTAACSRTTDLTHG